MVIDSFKALRDLLGRRRRRCGPSSTTSRSTSSSWGAASLLVGEYTDEEIASLSEFAIADGIIRLSNRRARAERDPRGRGPEAARRQLRHRRSLLRDRRRRARVLSARAQPGRRGRRAGGARRARRRPASPGSTRCSAAACRGRARRWSRAGPGPARRCSACSSSSRARGTGEPGIHFTLEETPNQLRRIAQGLGWDLRPLEERGLLTFSYVSPVELSTDRFLDRARQEVERLGRAARRARQPDQHGARRSLGAAVQGARLRRSPSTSAPRA